MRRIGAAAVVSTALALPVAGSAASSQEITRPNVLIIVTDDQRANDTMRVMPKTKRHFARHGVKFVNAVATTPVCCPARASIFTGRYAHNHNVRSNAEGEAYELDQETTMQYLLQEAGYRTGLIGKYLNHWNIYESPPYFDEFAITRGGYFNSLFHVGVDGAGIVKRPNVYSTRYLERRALRFIDRAETFDDQPWALMITPYAPHTPANPPKRYEHARVPRFKPNPAMLEEDLADKPPQYSDTARIFDRKDYSELRRQQLRSLMAVDDMVGRVLSNLEARNETDTLIFFLSDNGYLWGEHGLRAKATPYDHSITIPMMMSWADRFSPGTDDRLAANIDIAPTVLEAAAIEPEGMDGRSLLQTWDPPRVEILTEVYGAVSRPELRWASIVAADYQYVEYYGGDETVPVFREYYDLLTDAWQLDNLLSDGDGSNDPDVPALTAQLARYRTCPLLVPCP